MMPMDGVKVVDCSIALAGPWIGAILADQGAEVIKVERPGIGDIARYIGVAVNGMSALYQAGNRGKRCIALDVQTPAGVTVMRELVARADVFIQNFRPGVMDRLGLGYDDLRATNPELVYVSVSGFGPDGPYAGKSAYDTVIQAYAGLASSQADPADGVPVFLRQTAADKITALTATQAVTAALFARERGAGGQHVQVPMLEAVVAFLWADAAGNEMLLDADGSQPSSFVQSFPPLRFSDGGFGIATPTSDHDFAGICRALGVDGYDDPRVATIAQRNVHRDLARDMMVRCYVNAATFTTADAMARLEAERVPCGLVVAPADLYQDVHAQAIGMLVESDHPVVGRLREPRPPAHFEGVPAAPSGPAPRLGEHSDAILAELGYDPSAIEALRGDGVIA